MSPGNINTPDSSIRLRTLAIYYDRKGTCFAEVATPKSTGLRVITNIDPESFNRRDPKEGRVLFRTDAAAWGWARSIAHIDKKEK